MSPTPFLAVDNNQVEEVLVGSLSANHNPLSRTIRLYVSSEWEGTHHNNNEMVAAYELDSRVVYTLIN